MVPIMSLWLPIIVSAVFVFLASFVLHMVFTYHFKDFKPLPNEDAAANAVRGLNLEPGEYYHPHAADAKTMKDPAYLEKQKKGPLFMLSVLKPEDANMGTSLVQWFVYSIVIGIFAAYIAGRALAPDAHYLAVFRFAGATAFFCYAVGGWSRSIWYKQPWSVTAKNTFDGLVYGLLTAGTFGWLWPEM